MTFTRFATVAVLVLSLSSGRVLAQSTGFGVLGFVYSPSTGSFDTFSFVGTRCGTSIGASKLGLNDLGQMVGEFTTSSSWLPCHGFIRDETTFTPFDYPGAYYTGPHGINNFGQIVGTRCSFSPVPECTAFSKDGDAFTSYQYPSATYTYANGINNTGQIVGKYRIEVVVGPSTVQAFDHGLSIDGGAFTVIDFPGALHTELYGINDSAEIVGTYVVSISNWPGFRYRGFLKQGNTLTSIDYPDSLFTWAFGISDSGRVVGTYIDKYGFSHGFLREGDSEGRRQNKYSSFDVPAADTLAYGINNLGQIIGEYFPRPVIETINSLVLQVKALVLSAGTTTSLVAKLEAAVAAFNAGDITKTCRNVAAFSRQVEAQSGKEVMPADATNLLAAADRLKAMLGCR